MKDIVHQSILFGMYYVAKPPSSMESVNNEEAIPLTDATPQFRNFYVSNIVCNGAESAILIRGLPEMSIKNIHMETLSLKTDQGVNIIDAEGISLDNVYLESKNTNPLINIENGNGITLNHITYGNAYLLLKVSGKKSAQIKLLNTNASKAKTKVAFKSGADNNSLVTIP